MPELDRSRLIAASVTRIAGAVAAAIGFLTLILQASPWCTFCQTGETAHVPVPAALLAGGAGAVLLAIPRPRFPATRLLAFLELLLALALLFGHASAGYAAPPDWLTLLSGTPPAAALCLLLHACAMLLACGPSSRRWRSPVVATAGSAIVALALVSLLVKSLNPAGPATPGSGIDFPPFAAAALLALGIGLIGLAAALAPQHRTRRAPWLPMCIGIGLAVFTCVVWWNLTVFDRIHSQQILSSAAIALRTHVISQLCAEADRGERMANRWEISAGTPRELWEADAAGYIGDLPSLIEILWLDQDLTPRWGMPFAADDHRWHAAVASPRLHPALEAAREYRATTLSPSFLTPDRGTAFLISVPLYIGDRFDGLLVTAVSVPELLHSILSDSVLQGYVATVIDGGHTVFGPRYAAARDSSDESATVRIALSGLSWMLTVRPLTGSPPGARSSLPEATLIVGFIVAALVMLSVHLGQMAAERARELEALNAALERRVAARTAELQRAIADVQRSNQELEQFAYVASHDLQEPLRMVSSYVQLLARRYKGRLDPDADEFIGYAVDGAERMKLLINDLLAYSRLGTHGKPFRPVDTNAVAQLALRNLEFAIRDVAGEVTVAPLPTVPGDDIQLLQLFQNLIANALKFRSADPPRVHLAATRAGHLWHFTVRDNGIGIDPQYAERIFIIFRRLHAHHEYPGTGIGLAVCKKIVERHGGRIWVESQAGQGSTFHVELPPDAPAPAPAPSAADQPPARDRKLKGLRITMERTRPIRILLVEDNPGDVQLTREALRENKVMNELYVARDGEEALRFLRREATFATAPRPELILLDLNLPRKDGREVLADIKSDPDLRRIPVVVLTTSKAESDIVHSYDLHVNCYVTKPLNLDRFMEVVREIKTFWLSIVELPPGGMTVNRTTASLTGMLLAALLLGTAANLLSPRRIPWIEDWAHHVERGAAASGLRLVELADVQALVAAGTQLMLDARPAHAYNAGHIPGALSLPVDDVEAQFPPLAPALDPAAPLLVYCSGHECDESLRLGAFLQAQGYTNVAIFTGGYEAWRAATAGAAP